MTTMLYQLYKLGIQSQYFLGLFKKLVKIVLFFGKEKDLLQSDNKRILYSLAKTNLWIIPLTPPTPNF